MFAEIWTPIRHQIWEGCVIMTDNSNVFERTCPDHSGVCTNIQNIITNCSEYRKSISGRFSSMDKRMDNVEKEFRKRDQLLITILCGILVNSALIIVFQFVLK